MPKVLDIKVEIPDAVSDQGLKLAEAIARQSVLIALQQFEQDQTSFELLRRNLPNRTASQS